MSDIDQAPRKVITRDQPKARLEYIGSESPEPRVSYQVYEFEIKLDRLDDPLKCKLDVSRDSHLLLNVIDQLGWCVSSIEAGGENYDLFEKNHGRQLAVKYFTLPWRDLSDAETQQAIDTLLDMLLEHLFSYRDRYEERMGSPYSADQADLYFHGRVRFAESSFDPKFHTIKAAPGWGK